MKKQVANFEILRSSTGWYIIKQVYDDGGKLILEAAQKGESNAMDWIKAYTKKWGFTLGTIQTVQA